MPRKSKIQHLTKFEDLLPSKREPSKYLKFRPLNESQQILVDKIRQNDVTFISAPAGAGKTCCAVAMGLEHLNKGLVNKIVVTRPAVESEENLGFLPGALEEKLDPYLRPLYDEFKNFITGEDLNLYRHTGIIELCPIAFLRGRTFKNTFLICDEASNCTFKQILMLLTRIGEGSKFVINGDPTQSDLPHYKQGALDDAMERLEGLEGIANVYMEAKDIVRHRLINDIIKRLDDREFSMENNY